MLLHTIAGPKGRNTEAKTKQDWFWMVAHIVELGHIEILYVGT
jgi:hypothetical protein